MISQEYHPGSLNFSGRLQDELLFALKATPSSEISDWGKQIGSRFLSVGIKRVANFGSLVSRLSIGTADELVEAIQSVAEGRGRIHLGDRAAALSDATRKVHQGIETAFQGVAASFQTKPDEAAIGLLSSVVGFYLGIGHGKEGFGDGGIPDMDITLGGIGWHRSIFTHSIIAGAFVETAVLSLIDLNKTVYQNLPQGHSSFWDDLLRYADAAGNPFVTGASLGIASHLGIDTAIDGFTPYKDLPISLPLGAHEFLMGMNALSEGAYGAGRLKEGFSFEFGTSHRGSSNQNSTDPDLGSNMKLISNGSNGSLADLREQLGRLSPEERIKKIAEMARDVAAVIGADPKKIDDSLSSAKRKMDAAKEPFRLGIVGEFKVGKSTLINALLGQEIAYADLLEATATECRFNYGTVSSAIFHFVSGQSEEFSFDEANRILADRRDDTIWLQSLDHVEYTANADCLKSFDLWDSPGLGGSEHNERRANRFIEQLGGALWVMDAQLIGKASIAGPLQKIKSSGKPLICILNRIDEYTGDPNEIVQFINRSYPGMFSAVVPISAYNALIDRTSGRASPELDDLWQVVLSVMGGDEVQGGETRLKGSTSVAAGEVGYAVIALRRELQDKIGLVDHMRFNLRDAGTKLFEALPLILAEETDRAFSEMERDLWKLVDNAKGAVPVEKVVDILKDERRLSALTKTVIDAAMQRLNRLWSSLTEEAFTLSLSAISLPSNALNSIHVVSAGTGGTQLSKDSIEQGVYIGGVAASIAATIAAASTIVTWPVILVGVPIGALAAWREQRKADANGGDFSEQVSTVLATLKREFVTTLGREIKLAIESAIDVEICHRLDQKTTKITGAQDVQAARELENRLALMLDALDVPSYHAARDEWTGAEVLTLLQNPGAHVDLFLPDISFSLSPMLVSLPAETELRILVATSRHDLAELPDTVHRSLGGWTGKKRVRSITMSSGSAPSGMSTMIITSEEALDTNESLRGLASRNMQFKPHPQGRLAAQRLFASLWEGHGIRGEAVEVAPVL